MPRGEEMERERGQSLRIQLLTRGLRSASARDAYEMASEMASRE